MSSNNASEVFKMLFDGESYNELDAYVKTDSAVAFGDVGGVSVYAFCLDNAIDKAACKKIIKAYSLAEKTGCPIIGIYNCSGLCLSEGFELLNLYGVLVKSASRLSGVVPQISVISGSCLGVAAVTANMADAVIACENSDFYVNAPSDVTVEENAEYGAVDIVCKNTEEALSKAADIISLLPANNLSSLPYFEFDEAEDLKDGIVDTISDNQLSVEFKCDYAKEIKTVLTTVGGYTAGIINFNGEALDSYSAYKAEAFIKLCDAYNLPLITVADSKGTKNGNEAQLITALTKLVTAYAGATCPKISLITKESVAASYIILAGKGASSDFTIAWEGATVTPMSVESAVAFMWNDRLAKGEDRANLEEEYKNTLASAVTAAESGAVDAVIAPEQTKAKIIEYLEMLSSKRETTIPRKHSVK